MKAILTPLKRFIFIIPMLSGILYQPLLNNGLGLNSDYLTKVKAYNASSFIRWPQKVTKVKMYKQVPPTYPEDKAELILKISLGESRVLCVDFWRSEM